ncbi:hypothetical protein [Castellaniella sp.]|uniref:hypothetical protein n=1 Tax=Castellaniella sp. TaxID=1955812 RepID=UPI002AFFEEB9|nr:hypothetical protein [Castellaniella sp.]
MVEGLHASVDADLEVHTVHAETILLLKNRCRIAIEVCNLNRVMDHRVGSQPVASAAEARIGNQRCDTANSIRNALGLSGVELGFSEERELCLPAQPGR